MPKSNQSKRPYIVGVGASAGGLEALELFFKRFPADTGLSFVVIQHLSPDFNSLMDELLARHTDMSIYRVDKETKIQPNCIYLIPPKKNLAVKGTKLIPSDQDPSIQLRLPIDNFFTTLASQYGANAIAVILSGTGSDGTRGCAAVKENEGFVIAQDPVSCKFDGMPMSIINQGISDKILRPEEMSDMIISYTRHPAGVFDIIDPERESEKLRVITAMLQRVEGLDFTHYRLSTIARRIERRVKINHLSGLDEYTEVLNRDFKELKELHSELLIGVTSFFRDKEAFEVLSQQVIPKIIKEALNDEVIRVWVAGCSTGEEALSIGICFMECMDELHISKEIKIFATDVDREAIEFAAAGVYSESALAKVDPEIVKKYFIKKDSFYEVRSKLRRSIIFSQHNAVKDPPFTKMHLVSCRNLLIYFERNLQERAISLFHFGLRSNGILFLGKSEALGDLVEEFIPINPVHKIFQKVRDVKLSLVSNMTLSASKYMPSSIARSVKTEPYMQPRLYTEPQLNHLYEKLLDEYVPPCIVMDENYQLLHVFGDASKFLDVPIGKSTFSVLKMLDKDLSLALSTAVTRASKTEKKVVFKDIDLNKDGSKKVELQVKLLPVRSHSSIKSYMVFFKESDSDLIRSEQTTTEIFDAQAQSHELIENLEEQLLGTKESLQATIEELETTNEELQSTNEELMSSNEELQSSNEELQSVNEELYTVNAEHQTKIDELTQANNDIDFLLRSSNIGIVFLDEHLKIRRYNKDIQSIVNVVPHDVGRPITDITFKFGHDQVMNQIIKVSLSGEDISREIGHNGITYLVKCVAYDADRRGKSNTSRKKKNGVVVSFIDVSSMKEAQELKRLTEDAEEFNYVVSHDLRKPIRWLSNINKKMMELIKIDSNGAKSNLQECLAESQDTVGVLSNMLDQLLKYSRLRTRGGTFRQFEVQDAIDESIQRLNSKLDGVNISVAHLPERILGDAEQVKELFGHIFQNAVENRDPDRNLEIAIDSKKIDGFWEFTIKDNGTGFVKKDVKNAFEIFNSLDNKSPNGKLGVGLSLSKRIVDRHGGRIWVSTKPNIGTTIHFNFPEIGKPLI